MWVGVHVVVAKRAPRRGSGLVVEQLPRDADELVHPLVELAVQRTPDVQLHIRGEHVAVPGGAIAHG